MTAITLPRPPVDRSGPIPGAPGSNERPLEIFDDNPVGSEQPRARPALVVLLVATGVLYVWGLGASGWANSFYSAAVQAGTKSWKAFFFGSSDAANFITIDKPPAALWVMEISARLFGVNAWSILVPEALEGVAAVGLLYAGVRRWFGAGAGLLAGAVLAVTPVAALMFRFNNPDALLILALTAAAYAMVRALEGGSTRWLVAAGTLVGFGFVTKMLQALLVVPAFALVYLLAGPPKFGRRIVQLLIASVALAVSSLWWVVAVMAVPASQRPYIGGSQNNSLWNLIFGYNGFGRLTGNESGSVGGGVGNAGRWGPTGWLRMFNTDFGGQISWLLPAALIFLVAGVILTFRSRRDDRGRAGLILWGGWLLVTGLVFSLGQGIIHPYYTVALAPAIGALVGIGAAMWWRRRHTWAGRGVLSVAVGLTAGWSCILLRRSPSWHPWLRGAEVGVGVIAVALLVASFYRRSHLLTVAAAVTILFVGFAGPAAYALTTASTPHVGAIPSAGPAVVGGGFGPGGRGGGFARGATGGPPAGRFGGFGGGAFGGGGAGAFGGGALGGGAAAPGRGGAAPAGGGAPPGGAGGLLNGSTPTAALTATLKDGSSRFTWVAAAIGSNEASGYQLATGDPVMAIGGFNGTDPAPTLAQFESYVQQGKIHYFIAGGGFGGGGGRPGAAPGGNATASTSSQISAWVASNFTAKTVGNVTIYDLTSATGTATLQ